MIRSFFTFIAIYCLGLLVETQAQISVKILVTETVKTSGDTIHGCPKLNMIFVADAKDKNGKPLNDTTTLYRWEVGYKDIFYELMQTDTFVYSYPESGSYYISLIAKDNNGNTATAIRPLRIGVGAIFFETKSDDDSVCYTQDITKRDDFTLEGKVKSKKFQHTALYTFNEPKQREFSSLKPYSSVLKPLIYDLSQTLQNADTLKSVCAIMEHSSLGDLQIKLTCPNGKFILLSDYSNTQSYIGQPVDDDQYLLAYGASYRYCWSPFAKNGTMFQNAETNTYNYKDRNENMVENHFYVPAATYASATPFSDLVGCPMNGNWEFSIKDKNTSDNGYIWGWNLSFADTVKGKLWKFEQVYDEYKWISKNDNSYTKEWNTVTDTIGLNFYTFSVIDNFGCYYDTSIAVTAIRPEIVASTVNPYAIKDEVDFSSPTPWGEIYAWDLGDKTVSSEKTLKHTYGKEGKYLVRLVMTSKKGCTDFDTVMINAKLPELKLQDLPDIFTPNNDGINDLYIFTIEDYKEFECTIFNRWGNKVYHWTDPAKGWDGTNIGNLESPSGIYFYVVKVIELNGKKTFKRGTLQLVREK